MVPDPTRQVSDPDPQIIDHPYQPSEWGDICGRVVDGWPCGYSLSEHEEVTDPLECQEN